MTGPVRKRRKTRPLVKVLAAGVALLGAAVAGEFATRLLIGPPKSLGQLYFRDSKGEAIGLPGDQTNMFVEAFKRGLVQPLPPEQTPRQRFRFSPGARFYMCYTDTAELGADWFDDRGCVEVQMNSFGLREREALRPDNKQPGERRIVCIGDSFTFGWGIPVEKCWVRQLENELRESDGDVRTINCGASGAVVADEYQRGLETRFGQFQPDLVIVTLYMNDLVPSMGLCVLGPQPDTGSLLLDYAMRLTSRSPLDLDPKHDWVGELLAMPKEQGELGGVYDDDKPFEAMWSQGAPQRAIVAMRDWCNAHDSKLLVVLWPFLQGLGPDAWYPFEPIHDAVAVHCKQSDVPFLDLLPVLADTEAHELWVTPSDLHANPQAQQLVLPALVAFVRPHL